MVVDTSWRSFDWRGRGRDSMCTATVQLPDALSLMQTTWTTIPSWSVCGSSFSSGQRPGSGQVAPPKPRIAYDDNSTAIKNTRIKNRYQEPFPAKMAPREGQNRVIRRQSDPERFFGVTVTANVVVTQTAVHTSSLVYYGILPLIVGGLVAQI